MNSEFPLGRIVVTAGASELLDEKEMFALIDRHAAGDNNDLYELERTLGNPDIVDGKRVFSSYYAANGEKIWIMTTADRMSTTIFTPDEY